MADPIQSRVDKCMVHWYRWLYASEDSTASFGLGIEDNTLLSESESFDISDHIVEFSFSKNLGEAAGSFSLTLSNSLDWARYMKPGEWLTVFLSSQGEFPRSSASKANPIENTKSAVMSGINIISGLTPSGGSPPLPKPAGNPQDYKNKLRSMLLIQRVAMRTTTTVDGTVEVTYTITGKDLGVCLEETDLWFNFLYFEYPAFAAAVASTMPLQSVRNLTSYMDKCFSLFFRPDELFDSTVLVAPNSFISTLRQWLLPQQMLNDLGIKFDRSSFFGNISNIKDFQPTLFENVMTDPFAGLEGSAWTKLKGLSQPEFHEFFLEMDHFGEPKVVFRPIPWSIDNDNYPNIGAYVPKYLSLIEPDVLGVGSMLTGSISNITRNPLEAVKAVNNVLTSVGNLPIRLSGKEVYGFDIGPDFHNRFNHFLIAANNEGPKQSPLAYELLPSQKLNTRFPFKNISSIRRHGLRKRHFNIAAFLNQNSTTFTGPLSDNPQVQFLLEANEMMKDFWGKSEDFQSGSFQIAGRNDVRVGKAILTDDTVHGAANTVFYVEGYVDTYTVDAQGVGSWSQSIAVTRGVELEDLKSRSGFKTKAATKTGSFVKG